MKVDSKKIYKFISIISVTIVIALLANLIIPALSVAEASDNGNANFEYTDSEIIATGTIPERYINKNNLYWVISSETPPTDENELATWASSNSVTDVQTLTTTSFTTRVTLNGDGTYYMIIMYYDSDSNTYTGHYMKYATLGSGGGTTEEVTSTLNTPVPNEEHTNATVTGVIAEKYIGSNIYWVKSSETVPTDLNELATWCENNKIQSASINTTNISNTFPINDYGTYYAIVILAENGTNAKYLKAYYQYGAPENNEGNNNDQNNDGYSDTDDGNTTNTTEGNTTDENTTNTTDGNATDGNNTNTTDGNATDGNNTNTTDGNAANGNATNTTDGNAANGNVTNTTDEDTPIIVDVSDGNNTDTNTELDTNKTPETNTTGTNTAESTNAIGDTNTAEANTVAETNAAADTNAQANTVVNNVNNTNKSVSTANKKNITEAESVKKSDENMPQTGSNDTVIIVAIVIFAALGALSFAKYKQQ